jgi:hypothetical protein
LINNANDLQAAVSVGEEENIVSLPTARKALRGELLDRPTWEKIFSKLKLKWHEYFTEAEWYGWDLMTLWGKLLNDAEDGSERLGLVLCQGLERASMRSYRPETSQQRYLSQIRSGSKVLFEIPGDLSGHFVAIEQNHKGDIYLVAPSPLMKDGRLPTKQNLLPQLPVEKDTPDVLEMNELGTRYVWAAVFEELPTFEWLTSDKWQDLSERHLFELWEYVQTQPYKTPFWRFSYTVTT